MTYYRWKKRYGGEQDTAGGRKERADERANTRERVSLKRLTEENARLKRLVANQALDIQTLKKINLETRRLFRAEQDGVRARA